MAWVIWLVIAGVLIVAEMTTLTFYLLWLGIGALAGAAVAAFFPGALLPQVLAACIVAVLLTVYSKPLTRRVRQSRGFRDTIEDLVGKKGTVVEDIADGRTGIVRVGSETWSATATGRLAKGEEVIVVNRGTTVLQVEKWEGL